MSDEIADLHELMEVYRRKARSVGILPLAAAYDEAADQIEETIAELKAASWSNEASRSTSGFEFIGAKM